MKNLHCPWIKANFRCLLYSSIIYPQRNKTVKIIEAELAACHFSLCSEKRENRHNSSGTTQSYLLIIIMLHFKIFSGFIPQALTYIYLIIYSMGLPVISMSISMRKKYFKVMITFFLVEKCSLSLKGDIASVTWEIIDLIFCFCIRVSWTLIKKFRQFT